jgi:hypothetical protein
MKNSNKTREEMIEEMIRFGGGHFDPPIRKYRSTGPNLCCEISLGNPQVCNLATVNIGNIDNERKI